MKLSKPKTSPKKKRTKGIHPPELKPSEDSSQSTVKTIVEVLPTTTPIATSKNELLGLDPQLADLGLVCTPIPTDSQSSISLAS